MCPRLIIGAANVRRSIVAFSAKKSSMAMSRRHYHFQSKFSMKLNALTPKVPAISLSHSSISLENLESPGVTVKPASRAALAV